MSAVATAIVGGAVLGAVVSSNNTNKAVSAQQDAANQANATSQAQSDQARADNAPWRDRGNMAGNALQARLGLGDNTTDPNYGSMLRKFSQSDLNADPVYQNGLQFGLQQGTQGINRQAAASGGLGSGAVLKALTRFGNDYGSTKANESYNRFTSDNNNIYNKLAGVAGTGQVANQQIGAQGANAANNISQNQIGVGNARASGYIAQGNALTGAISQGVNAYGQYNALNRNNNNTYVPYIDGATNQTENFNTYGPGYSP